MISGAVSEVFAGNTSEVWEVGFVTSEDGVLPIVLADLTAGYTCRLAVQGSTVVAPRAVTALNAGNTRFRAWLTPAETAALGVGQFTVGLELSNPTLSPPLVQEIHVRVRVLKEAVPAL